MTTQAPTYDPGLDPIEESSMTLMEHLLELRTRLIWIVSAMVICTAASMSIIWIFDGPGAAFAMPIIVYQLVAFAAPGLYPHEKRALLFSLPGIFKPRWSLAF